MRKKTPIILLVLFVILLSLGCKKDFNTNSSGVKLSKKNQLNDTIITSIFENPNYSIAKILIRKNNSEIIKNAYP